MLDTVRRLFAVEPMNQPQAPRIQTRQAVEGSLEDFALRVLGRGGTRPGKAYRVPSIGEALRVPAVLSAVTKIANLTGSLTMEVLRDGVRIERPTVIARPNPLTTPRDFFRDVAWCMAVYGEAWLWIAKRDTSTDLALALVPINPLELKITEQGGRRIIEWRDTPMNPDDLRQITYLRDPGALRGKGPLQYGGAAVSVAVEAQTWAANYYAEGGIGGPVIKHADQLSPDIDPVDGLTEADRLRAQWTDRPNNVPRVIDQNIESVEYPEVHEDSAQMMSARMYQNGEIANLFSMPGPLLEYSAQGSSLTYRSIPDLIRQFMDLCLGPNYLEPIEQTMSDLLPNRQSAQFVRSGLLRADPKAQMEIAALGFEKGVLDREEARAFVGVEPSIETEPVPFAPPRALPSIQVRNEPVRCSACGRTRMIVYPGGGMRCVSCKTERATA